MVYWGALEPLGQSLVVPAVTRLAELGADLTLVTFEKAADASQPRAMEAVDQDLRARGVTWIPLVYHKRPQIAAKTWDVLNGVARGLVSRLRGQIDIVHARTFLGGVMGRVTAALLGAKLVFHNEGFYPDEQVDGGVWAEGSLIHRVAREIEGQLYRRADAIIVLSQRAQQAIARRETERSVPTIVVPSAVDLDRFRPMPSPRDRHRPDASTRLRRRHRPALSVSPRCEVRRCGLGEQPVASDCEYCPERSRHEVRQLVERSGLDPGSWSLASLPHADMPAELVRHDAGLFFLARGLSEHGCSPTKIGEYWASGLPVVTTPNVSDTDDISPQGAVGVVLADHTEQTYETAVHQLRCAP